jgi:hypothetical protein
MHDMKSLHEIISLPINKIAYMSIIHEYSISRKDKVVHNVNAIKWGIVFLQC